MKKPIRTHFQFGRYLVGLVAVAAVLLSNAPAFAVPADMSPDKTPYQTLELKAESGMPGKLVRARGTVGPGVERFFVDGLNIMSPVSVTVLAKDPAMPIKVSLHRWLWKEADAAGDTTGSGEWNFTGRLHKEVGIQLEAAEPSEFYVLVWSGVPVPASQMDFVQPASALGKSTSSDSEGSNTMLVVVIGLLVVVIALLAVMVFRKKGGGSAPTVAVLVLAVWAAQPSQLLADAMDEQAQQPVSKATDSTEVAGEKSAVTDAKPETESDWIAGKKPQEPAAPDTKPDTKSDWIAGKKPQEPEAPGKKPQEPETAGKKPQEPEAPGKKPQEPEAPGKKPDANRDYETEEPGKKPDPDQTSSDSGSNSDSSFEDRIAAADERIRDLQTQINSLSEALGELEFLIEQDRSAVPDEAPGGVAPLASACLDDPDCSVCVVDAQQEMDGLLSDYERLRIIYTDTKSHADWMTNLGDATSGWHQLEQAAWFQEKLKIAADVQGLQAAYDRKLEQFNGELEGYLRRIDQCEADFGNEGWYAREGQSFKQTIAFHYLRKN